MGHRDEQVGQSASEHASDRSYPRSRARSIARRYSASAAMTSPRTKSARARSAATGPCEVRNTHTRDLIPIRSQQLDGLYALPRRRSSQGSRRSHCRSRPCGLGLPPELRTSLDERAQQRARLIDTTGRRECARHAELKGGDAVGRHGELDDVVRHLCRGHAVDRHRKCRRQNQGVRLMSRGAERGGFVPQCARPVEVGVERRDRGFRGRLHPAGDRIAHPRTSRPASSIRSRISARVAPAWRGAPLSGDSETNSAARAMPPRAPAPRIARSTRSVR